MAKGTPIDGFIFIYSHFIDKYLATLNSLKNSKKAKKASAMGHAHTVLKKVTMHIWLTGVAL